MKADVCQHKNCKSKPTCAGKLNVPAMDWPIDMHQPIGIIIGMPLCDKHFDELETKHFISPQLRQTVDRFTAGRCPPDFNRAFFSRVKLDSPEYLLFEKQGNA